MPAWFSLNDLYYLLPELVLTAGILLLLIVNVLIPRSQQRLMSWLGLAVLGATAVAMMPLSGAAPVSVSKGLVAVDAFSFFFKVVFLLSIRHHRQLSFDFARLWPGAGP